MSYLITPPPSPWLELCVDVYLDRRHHNWVLAEDLGDVMFISERGVVLVHRERAEDIAVALLGGRDVLMLEAALALPAKTRPSPYACRRRPLPAPAASRSPCRPTPGPALGATSGAGSASRWASRCW